MEASSNRYLLNSHVIMALVSGLCSLILYPLRLVWLVCDNHYDLCCILQLKMKQALFETQFHELLPHLLDVITRSLFFECLNVLIYTWVPLQEVIIPLSSISLCISSLCLFTFPWETLISMPVISFVILLYWGRGSNSVLANLLSKNKQKLKTNLIWSDCQFLQCKYSRFQSYKV